MPSEFLGPAFRRKYAQLRAIALVIFGFVFIATSLAMTSFAVAQDDGGDAAALGASKPWPRVPAQSQLYELPASMTAGSGEKK